MYIIFSLYFFLNVTAIEILNSNTGNSSTFECSMIVFMAAIYYIIIYFNFGNIVKEKNTVQELPNVLVILYFIIFNDISIYVPLLIYSSYLSTIYFLKNKNILSFILKINIYLRNIFFYYFLFFMLIIDVFSKIDENFLYFYFIPLVHLLCYIYSLRERKHLIFDNFNNTFYLLFGMVATIIFFMMIDYNNKINLFISVFFFFYVFNSLKYFKHLFISSSNIMDGLKIDNNLLREDKKTIFYNPEASMLANDIEFLFDNGVYLKLINYDKLSSIIKNERIIDIRINNASYLKDIGISSINLIEFLKIYNDKPSYINKRDIEILKNYKLIDVANYLKLNNIPYSSITDMDLNIINVLKY